MRTRVLVIWVLGLAVVWAWAFGIFRAHFSGTQYLTAKVQALEKKLRRAERQMALRELAFQEYQDEVASARIQIEKTEGTTDQLRRIASVGVDPKSKILLQITPGKELFKKGKTLFLNNSYAQATEVFAQLISDFPDSSFLPEAAYLQAESFFALRKFEECSKSIDFLTTHFPETEFAAYGLLRLGQIFEELERFEDASDVYQLVISNFKSTAAEDLAKKYLAGLSL